MFTVHLLKRHACTFNKGFWFDLPYAAKNYLINFMESKMATTPG